MIPVSISCSMFFSICFSIIGGNPKPLCRFDLQRCAVSPGTPCPGVPLKGVIGDIYKYGGSHRDYIGFIWGNIGLCRVRFRVLGIRGRGVWFGVWALEFRVPG